MWKWRNQEFRSCIANVPPNNRIFRHQTHVFIYLFVCKVVFLTKYTGKLWVDGGSLINFTFQFITWVLLLKFMFCDKFFMWICSNVPAKWEIICIFGNQTHECISFVWVQGCEWVGDHVSILGFNSTNDFFCCYFIVSQLILNVNLFKMCLLQETWNEKN